MENHRRKVRRTVNLTAWDDTERITEALQRAVREARECHRRLGNPVAVWQDGKVMLLSPENLGGEAPAAH